MTTLDSNDSALVATTPPPTADLAIQQVSLGEGQTAAAAVSAAAAARIQARAVVAMQRPRDIDVVRQHVLKDCARRSFAESAIYAKPVGGSKVEGFSIRFVEQALRHMRNVSIETEIVFDSPESRIIQVVVTDQESNTTYQEAVSMEKVVERRQVKKGQDVVRTRIGAQGQTLFVLRATDDDMLARQNALVSKAIRNCGLRIIPSWLLEEARIKTKMTIRGAVAEDPDAAKRRMLDAFGSKGATVDQLKQFLEVDTLESIDVDQITELRDLYAAIDSGEITMRQALEEKHGVQVEAEVKPSKAAESAKAAIDAAKASKDGGDN